MYNNTMKKNMLHRLGALVLALCMSLSLLPVLGGGAEAAYSDSAMDDLLNWGVVSGYPDGSLRPERSLTRAEFVAMVNRAYGFTQTGPTPFTDVPEGAWYHDDIGIAYNANYFTGVTATTALPNGTLTREQAVVLLGRNMRLDPAAGEVTEFSDGRDFGQWSRGYARAAAQAGIIGGYPDGSFQPKSNITRGDMAVMLKRALGTLINQPGTHTLSDTYGNVTISSPGTTLKDTTIAGDLYLTGGLDLGDITLENVKVLGDIIVAGGGESQSGESIILRNVEADSLKVDSIADQYVSLAAEGNTVVEDVSLRSNAYIQDRTRPGEGFKTITLESPDSPAEFTLSGNLETVVNKTPDSLLTIAMGTVDSLKIDEKATNSTLNLDINSTAMALNLDTAANVVGVGDIAKLYVNAPGSNVEMLPDTITIRPGLVAEIAGETMDAKQAQESSSDPRLLAGYPKVKNIAPTSATAVYSANKSGTVYWAVSTTTDGSIPEEELVEPTQENTRIFRNGNTAIELADTEYTAALEQLAADSNYYLSTVLIDARGRHSPVKVASFTTPDNTVPVFTPGYPSILRNYTETVRTTGNEIINGASVEVSLIDRDSEQNPKRNYRVQVAAMPNKNCQLYYAVYEAGSTAPTAQQFRTGALGKPIRSGVDDATKNRINYIELTNLEELTTYDIYLCLIDADGARSSAVQKLTFTTVDGKPPRFQYDTPAVTQEQLNALRLNVNVNENATVYWVASKSAEYIKDNIKDGKSEWTEAEWWERACRQIESGTNSVRSGSLNVRGNTDSALNVTGLEPATSYYIYFVAKDAAGNYSEFFREAHTYDVKTADGKTRTELNVTKNEQPFKYFIQANTLDNVPPTVKQEFTHYDAADNTRPYADTDIRLVFSEEVMQYSTNRENTQETLKTFKSLYDDMKLKKSTYDSSPTDENKTAWTEAQTAFANALRSTIKLYNASATGNESVIDRSDPLETKKDKWIIDYRNAEVEVDDETGELTLFFPGEYSQKDESLQGIHLSSGSTYYFVFDDIADISTSRNRMGRTQLENFTTVSAQVQLRSINVTNANVSGTAIPIDMAFSMTPISTNVEENIDWDILLWSDYSVSFEIYELNSANNNTVATPVKIVKNGEMVATDEPTDVPIDNDNAQTNPDYRQDDYQGYIGRSLFRDFFGLSLNPSVTGEGNRINMTNRDAAINKSGIMEAETSKYYGIHFTSVNHVKESSRIRADGDRSEEWDATINFRVSVVTGESTNLGNLSSAVTKDNLATYEERWNVAQIHAPRPFSLLKQFANSNAPKFAAKYPQFNPQDTSMDIPVMLDRSGTLFWVVAPVSTRVAQTDGTFLTTYAPTVTTLAYNRDNPNDTVGKELIRYGGNQPTSYHSEAGGNVGRYYAQYGVGESSKLDYVPLNGSDTRDTFLLTSPSYNQIRTPNFGSDRIKSGSKVMGVGADTIHVDGLEPETDYFVYFVMQGVGQVFSERAQLFQTRTTEISRPRLSIQAPSSSLATITSTNMDAVADCGLFLMDRLGQVSLLSKKFFSDDVIDGDFSVALAEVKGKFGPTGINDTEFKDYTVWQAIAHEITNEGSLFDKYAAESVKNNVAALIRTNDTSGGRTDGSANVALTEGSGREMRYELTPGLEYILLVVARSSAADPNASGHSLGFGAAQPLYVTDDAQPTILDISGDITVDFQRSGAASARNNFLMSGYITLTFDRPLYLYNKESASATPTRVPLTEKKSKDNFLSPNYSGTDYKVHVSSEVDSELDDKTPLSEVRIDLNAFTNDGNGGVQDGASFQVNHSHISGQYSAPRSETLSIALNYDSDTGKVMATVVDNTTNKSIVKAWFPTEVSNINTHVISPLATDFSLNSTNLGTLKEGDTKQLIATLSPPGAIGEVRFSSADASIAGVSTIGQPANAALVTAGSVNAKTSTTITARLYVNNQPVKDAEGKDIEKQVSVTVTPSQFGVVRVDPVFVELVAGKQAGPILISVDADGAPDKKLDSYQLGSSGYYTGASGLTPKIRLSGHLDPSEESATYYISVDSDYKPPANGEQINVYFTAVDNARIKNGQLTVWLTRAQ